MILSILGVLMSEMPEPQQIEEDLQEILKKLGYGSSCLLYTSDAADE